MRSVSDENPLGLHRGLYRAQRPARDEVSARIELGPRSGRPSIGLFVGAALEQDEVASRPVLEVVVDATVDYRSGRQVDDYPAGDKHNDEDAGENERQPPAGRREHYSPSK